MKRLLFFICILCGKLTVGQLDFKNSNVGRMMNLADLDGHSLLKKYDPDVTGTPFINDNWVSAKITLSKGKEIGPLQVKLNLESNESYYLDSANKELIAQAGVVRKVECIDYYAKDGTKYIFKSGYPAIDKQDENFYYQVFTEGKIELLAKKFKYIRSERNDLTGETSKTFIDGSVVLYVYAYGLIQTLHPTKEFIDSLFEEDKQQAAKAFIETNKISFKKIPDLVKAFNYYNNLH
jgi:hypothetical protein